MNHQEIIEMLKELVNEIDYDIYKEMFVYEERENVNELVKIVKKHLQGKAKPATMKETKQLTTEVWGLNFFIKGDKLCWVTRTPQGKETRHWMDMPAKVLKGISKVINEHLEAEAEDAKLTPAQLAEKYQEMMGS